MNTPRKITDLKRKTVATTGAEAFDGDVCHEHGDVTVQDVVKMMSDEYCKMLTYVVNKQHTNTNQTIGE